MKPSSKIVWKQDGADPQQQLVRYEAWIGKRKVGWLEVDDKGPDQPAHYRKIRWSYNMKCVLWSQSKFGLEEVDPTERMKQVIADAIDEFCEQIGVVPG